MGQAQTVLSGFKMACLQYAPGPVQYGKIPYARSELLDLRERLLNQALKSLSDGPSAGSPSSRLNESTDRQNETGSRLGRPPSLKQSGGGSTRSEEDSPSSFVP